MVLLGKILNSHSVSSTQVYKWVPKGRGGGGEGEGGRGERGEGGEGGRNTLTSHFMLQKVEISSSLYGPLGWNTDFTFYGRRVQTKFLLSLKSPHGEFTIKFVLYCT